MRDILLIRELQRLAVRFDPPEETIRPWSPLLLTMLDYPFRTSLGAYTFISTDPVNGSPPGFVQVRPRQDLPEWDIVSLAPSIDARVNASGTWERLLHHVAEIAGSHEVLRVFVKAAPASQARDVFSRCAFSGYAYENIWAASDVARINQGSSSGRPRSRRSGDTWALHQLYLHATPAEIQAAEGRPVLGLSSGIRLGRWHMTREYVWEDGGQICGYLAISRGPKGVALSPLVDPDASHCAAEMLAWGVTRALAKRSAQPVYCVTRHYDQVTAPWLRGNGFIKNSEWLLMVKQLAVRVKEPLLRLEPSLKGRVNTAVTRTCDEYKPGKA